jgi:hypothetical protein
LPPAAKKNKRESALEQGSPVGKAYASHIPVFLNMEATLVHPAKASASPSVEKERASV